MTPDTTPRVDAQVTTSSAPARRSGTTLERSINGELDVLAHALARAAHPRQRAALEERMVLLALPLADLLARRYVGRGIETDDLVQVARTALFKAIRRYEPGSGSGFAAFAVPTISGELKRWFRDHGWSVRPPRRVQELRPRLAREEERMRQELSRNPRMNELAGALGVTLRDVGEVRLCSQGYRAASLDVISPSGESFADPVLVTESPMDVFDRLDALGWAISRLSGRQQLILRLRFVEERTQAQIGAEIGVSQMQVCRLLQATFAQLRRDIDGESEESPGRERRTRALNSPVSSG